MQKNISHTPVKQKTKPAQEAMVSSVYRLSNLIDGIFAITMTILVFNLMSPAFLAVQNDVELYDLLGQNIPNFLSFLISFVILGQLWMSNVTIVKYIKHTDHEIVWMNVMFLLFVCLIPFTANLLGHRPLSSLTQVIYGSNMLLAMLANHVVWHHTSSRSKALTEDGISISSKRFGHRISFVAILAYIIGIGISLVEPFTGLVIYSIIPLPFVFGLIYHLRKLE